MKIYFLISKINQPRRRLERMLPFLQYMSKGAMLFNKSDSQLSTGDSDAANLIRGRRSGNTLNEFWQRFGPQHQKPEHVVSPPTPPHSQRSSRWRINGSGFLDSTSTAASRQEPPTREIRPARPCEMYLSYKPTTGAGGKSRLSQDAEMTTGTALSTSLIG